MEFNKIGQPSGTITNEKIQMRADSKEKWITEKGFITGLKSKFFRNGSAWKERPRGVLGLEPYIAGVQEIGNSYRSRQASKNDLIGNEIKEF